MGLALGTGVFGCELEELGRDVCGNQIIEAGEDCDGAAVESLACNAACRVECGADSKCPAGWGCGTDGLCRQPSGVLEARVPPSPCPRIPLRLRILTETDNKT